ncbi:hypothetical protein PTTG_12401 [Puccinia triticina 1-1 BBBD Race 1]|uniref:Uncharacterized protein n=1 Tax=Puccinia triticina (isolate 1-1 / race 1 (BBBD)) TaxID=630390 RepID=A0A180GKP9_PUCT1|nr:hypothetical protein PTTG_12401 [Puccinia triticina 1-1 BBBD Race 1]WAR52066.1 hypothetical protein PtB15_1B505 [Puccinia triticina]
MVDSASDTSVSDELREHQRIWAQGDLVSKGFRRLAEKYGRGGDPDRTTIEHTLSTRSVEEVALLQETLLHQLQSYLLPALHGEITILSNFLAKPLDLLKEPETKMKLVLKIQSHIERTVDKIKFSISFICPEPETMSPRAPHRFDDQHLKRFKSYRLRSLRAKFFTTYRHIYRAVGTGHLLFKNLKSLPEINPEYTFDPWKWWNVESTLDAIDLTIECITGSELDVAQLDWPSYLDDVDHVLHKVVTVINQCTHEVPRKTFVQEPVFHLAKLGIGLIKIAKLFFKKLSIDRSLNARRIPLRLPLFTEMCSKRIESLAQSLPLVTADILQLGNLFETVYDAHENRSGRDFVKVATSLKSRFQAPLVVLLHYLIPSISDTYGSSTQDYYKNWFVTWNTQFILTTENFISAAKSLDNNPP